MAEKKGLKIISYNCRGLPKDRSKLSLRPDVNNLFDTGDIIAFQETHYSKQNIKILNSLHDSFVGFGVAKVDECEGITQGRISGGVAIMWRSELSKFIKTIDLNVNWCTAIEVAMADTKFIILNVYLPYQSHENEDLYIEYLGFLKSLIDEMNCTNICIIGDFNANLGLSGSNLFAKYMLEFCDESNLKISDKIVLPSNSYSYVSSREGVHFYSWLDHVVSSHDFHSSIDNISIAYEMTHEDHIPVFIDVNINFMPEFSHVSNTCTSKIKWDSVSEGCLKKYLNQTDKHLSNINIPVDALCCSDLHCRDSSHSSLIKSFYDEIIQSLNNSSQHIFKKSGNFKNNPDWSDYVADIYKYSCEIRRLWLDNGKPRHGPLFHEFSRSKARFKYTLRYISRNEDLLRQESLAKKLSESNPKDFWSDVNKINNSKTPLPSSVDNANTPKDILNLWYDHFNKTFNCLPKQIYKNSFSLDTEYDRVKVCGSEIVDAIKSLDINKTCGLDGIYAEHLKYASDKLIPLLSLCFTGLFVHGILPNALMSVVLVPIIKDKCGSINAKENYQPIALASIVSKVLESIILNRMGDALNTNGNQFGFKKAHGTDQCIYILKEVIQLYKSLNTCISVCFLDASKAFDRVNHQLLFDKLEKRGVPGYILRLLVFWYENQTMSVRWGNLISNSFLVSNGVRQGGILSPYFFNVYMDDLSTRLNNLKIGCSLGDFLINHLMYADDLVLISPSTRGLSSLIKECQQYGLESDILFNSSKSAVMFFKPSFMLNINFPSFKINNESINTVDKYTYLGHIICNDSSDDMDILRQRRKIYAQGNSIMRKFYMCSDDVKVTLFRSYCSSFYTAQLWINYTATTMHKLYTAYHNVLKMFIGLSKYEHTRPICVKLNVKYCPALIRNLISKFMSRLLASENRYIKALHNMNCFYNSSIWKHWRYLLYTNGVG